MHSQEVTVPCFKSTHSYFLFIKKTFYLTNEKYVSNTLIIQLTEYTKAPTKLFLLYNLPNFLQINRLTFSPLAKKNILKHIRYEHTSIQICLYNYMHIVEFMPYDTDCHV